jgi:hypothetical protein
MINKLYFKDFEPQVVDKSFWKGSNYEPMSTVIERVNDGIRKNHNNDIINLETLMVTHLYYVKEDINVKKKCTVLNYT